MNANNQKGVKQRHIKQENKNESRITSDLVSSTTKNSKGNKCSFRVYIRKFRSRKYSYTGMRGSG